MIRMRPGVPWNVKGIEAEARDMAQLAARRAGVSLGEWLTQVIMVEGRGAPQQAYYVPGDGTYGPAPQPQYQPPPLPSLRYPQTFPQQAYPQPQPQPQGYAQQQPQGYAQQQPHAYQQPYPHAPQPQQHPHLVHPQPQQAPQQQYARDPLGGAAQMLDSQIRGSEFTVVAHGLRDLADRLEGSERRAQQAIATVNQSVAAMQDRIDAAERVKQLADVAFTSAADALATSARDQSMAFESLESTVRGVQKRLNEIEAGRTELPGKDAMGRLETALGQLQKRLGEMESTRGEAPYKDVLHRMEATVGALQKRLGEIETARHEFPHKDAMARLEAQIGDVRHDIADSEKRSREDLTQLAKFMRELGTRVDAAERNTGGKQVEGVSARLDALEARSQTMFEDMRGSLSSMDSRIAQAAASTKGGIPTEAFNALKRSFDQLNTRIDGVSQRVESIAERFEGVGDPADGPLSGPFGAIESTLDALTTKIEDGERRAADSVATVSNALKTISTRLDESDKRQAQAVQTMTRRFDDVERKTAESSHTVEDSLKTLTQRLEASDKKHKEAIGGLRLTVDGLVAKAAAEALPLDGPTARATTPPSHLSSTQTFAPPAPNFAPPAPDFVPPPRASDRIDRDFTPFTSTIAKHLSDAPPPPPSFDSDLPPPTPEKDGYSVSALQTIMAGTLAAPPPSDLPEHFESDGFSAEPTALDSDGFEVQPRKDDFLSQARRAAQAAAQAESERPQQRKGYLPYGKSETGGGRNVGRLMIITLACVALVAGIVALLFTMPGPAEETNQPTAGESLGEIINGPGSAPAEASPGPGAAFVPPTSESTVPVEAASVAVEPNGLGIPTSETPPSFTAGTSPLPGGSVSPSETAIAALEASATRGDARAQLVLALRYSEGRGVEKDDAKAASLVTKAAEQGLTIAEYRLGAIYERGVGVPKDLAQARTWYEKAAKGGNRKAMHNLAVLYAEGDVIGKNFQEAARWFRQGAEHGLADSQYNFAILLEQGMGVEKNLNEAAKWYAVALAQGDVGAAERLEALKRTLPAGDVALALDAAKNFKPKPLNQSANDVPAVAG